MRGLNIGVWMVALLALSNEAGATTVQRCVGSGGQVTFTHTSCPDHSVGQRERVWSPTPGSVAPAVRQTASQAPKVRSPRAGDPDARAVKKPGAVPKQVLPVEEKAETKKKGTKKKKVKYTPWRPTRS